jgi:ligand-binding sensor domain-containing protein/two-component sensor histidine kinase
MTLKSLAAALVLWCSFAQGQHYNFTNHSIKDGLAQTQARAIAQDHNGYLWVATISGLSRFDGIDFTNYSTQDGLLNKKIASLLVTNDGNLWIGTNRGISQFDGTTFTNFPFPKDRDSRVGSMAEDNAGNIWCASNGDGLIRFNKNTHEFSFYNRKYPDHGFTDDVVRYVYFDGNGKLWIGAFHGLRMYDGEKFHNNVIPGLDDVNISSISKDNTGRMWFGTSQGVYSYKETLKHYDTSNGLINNEVSHICPDYKSNIWIATPTGMSKYDAASDSLFKFDESIGLPVVPISHIFEDNEHNIWISTDGKGILHFPGEAFQNYSVQDGICSNVVLSITEDLNGNYWFGTYNSGLCKFDGTNFESLQEEAGIAREPIWTSLCDSKGRLWFGSSGGLYLIENDELTTYTEEDSLLHNKISSLHEDELGNIWIGSSGGITRYDGEHFSNWGKKQGFPGNNVRAIVQGNDGTLWCGTSSGLVHYDQHKSPATFELFTAEDGISANRIKCMVKGPNNDLWLGTSYGITHYDGETFSQILVSTEHLENGINFLELDDDNNLWIGINKGAYRLRLQPWFDEHRVDKDLFTDLDGIQSPETNLNASFKDSKGNLWFGTSEALVRYIPEEEIIIDTAQKPFINLTEIKLALNVTDWSEYADSLDPETGFPVGLQLPPNKNYLTFYFTGISHTNPKKVRYKFILEGFDETWSPVTKARSQNYSNLPHGIYTFRVLAMNKDGRWSPSAASFSFTILTPFHLAWWFILLSVAFGILIIFLIYNWRAKVANRKQETEQLVNKSKMLALEQQTLNSSMNRHFIFNALNSIQYYINREDKRSANKYLTSFAKLVRKNLDSSQSTLVSLSEELERLELYLSLEHMRFQQKFSYEIDLDSYLDAETTKIPAMLLQPYVENSIWHGILPMDSEDGKITVRIRKVNTSIVFTIQDNGIGISTSMKGKGEQPQDHISKGMSITSGRINLLRKMTNETIYIKGPYEVKDANEKSLGTKVEIVLPLDEEYLWN